MVLPRRPCVWLLNERAHHNPTCVCAPLPQYIVNQRLAKIGLDGRERTVDDFEFLTCTRPYHWMVPAKTAPGSLPPMPGGVVPVHDLSGRPRFVIAAIGQDDEFDVGKFIPEQGLAKVPRRGYEKTIKDFSFLVIEDDTGSTGLTTAWFRESMMPDLDLPPAMGPASEHLIEVSEFWDAQLKQFTYHTGWQTKEAETDHGVLFFALARRLPGTVAAFTYWDRRRSRLTLHTEPAASHEVIAM